MNQGTFRRALRYGFGRAILHLQQHESRPYRQDILEGCLHFWGYDGDFDTNRPDYMFEVISLTGEREFYRNHILAAVETATDDRDGDQLFALTRLLAESGDEEARSTLDRALERLPFHDMLAEDAIMRQGPDGLLRVLRLQLDYVDREGDADHNVADFPWILVAAIDRWGKRAFATVMRDAGHVDPRIKTLWKQLRQDEAKWRQPAGARPDHPVLTYKQVNEVLANPAMLKVFGGNHPSSALGHWAKTTTDDEWRRLCTELASLPDDNVCWPRAVRFLFNRRPFQGNPQRLITTVRAARLDRIRPAAYNETSDQHARYAMNALTQISHPDVRSFALELLATSKWTSYAASLLETNYIEGDLEVLAAVFCRERSEWQRHGVAISVLRIDERFSPAGAPAILRMLYERVRCGMCRLHLVECLHAHGALPASIAEECCYDAYFDLRERIAELVPRACGDPDGHERAGEGNTVPSAA